MKKPFFSILVPVYNVEKYLAACIESVLKQTFTDYELILADDGSTDSSGAICDEYAKKFPAIKVFHKKNEGLLQTRRFLLGKSSGNFLLALDSDDSWEQGLLKTVYDTVCEHDADMVLFALNVIADEERVIYSSLDMFSDRTIFTDDNKGLIYAETVRSGRLNSLCTKAVKRELVDFDADYREWRKLAAYEDLVQSFPLFKKAKKIVYRNRAYYRYRVNKASRTYSFRFQYITDIDAVRRKQYEILREEGYDTRENMDAFFTRYLATIDRQIKRIARMKMPCHEKRKCLQKVRDLAFYQRAVSMRCYRKFARLDQFSFFLFRKRADKTFLLLTKAAFTVKKPVRYPQFGK